MDGHVPVAVSNLSGRIQRMPDTTDETAVTEPVTMETIRAMPPQAQALFKFACRDRRRIDGPSALQHLPHDVQDWVMA